MVILEKKYTIKELYEINSFINGFVKGVVGFMVFLAVEWEYWTRILWQKQRR